MRVSKNNRNQKTTSNMNQNGTQPQMNIDFKNTTPVEGFDGGQLFGQAFVIRKVSKFVKG